MKRGMKWQATGWAMVLAMGSGSGFAQVLSGRLRTTFETVRDDNETLEVLEQNYQFQWRMPVTNALTYSIRLRYVDTDTNEDFSSLSEDGSQSLLEPTVEIDLRTPVWDLSTGFRYTEERQKSGETNNRETRGDWFSRLNWRPVGLPILSILYDTTRFRSNNDTVNMDEDRLFADASYSAGPVRLSYNLEDRGLTDHSIGFEKDSTLQVLNADYQGRSRSGKFSLGAGLLVQDERTTEVSGSPVDVARRITATAGLFAVDTTPLLGTLPPQAGLIDGDTLAPTPVTLGGTVSGGGTQRNIGLDLDVAETIDGMEIWVEVPLPPRTVDRFSWALYVSDNNLDWSLAASAVRFTFNDIFNRFELSFSPVTFRFIKVVNTGFDPTFGPVSATEAVATSTSRLVGRSRRRDRTRNGSLTLSYTPGPRWNISSSSFFGTDREDRPGQTTGEDRLDQSVSVFYRPAEHLSTTALVRRRLRNRTETADEDDMAVVLGVSATPYETLDLALSYERRREKEDSRPDLDVNAWHLRSGAQLLEDLNVSLDLGYSNTFDFDLGQRTRARSARLMLFTRPRPELIFSSDYLVDQVQVRGTGVAGTGRRDQTLWTNRLLFRPNAMVNLSAELRYEDFPSGSGVAKAINLDWLPFPDGAVQWSFSYLTNAQAVFGGRRDQFRSLLRWQVRSGVLFDVNYFRDTFRDTGQDLVTRTLSTVLEIRF
ncbi:MAG: hypothetical protein ACE5HD_06185 [Acidobacteriota bacterium]